jgi:hypothetical protein
MQYWTHVQVSCTMGGAEQNISNFITLIDSFVAVQVVDTSVRESNSTEVHLG